MRQTRGSAQGYRIERQLGEGGMSCCPGSPTRLPLVFFHAPAHVFPMPCRSFPNMSQSFSLAGYRCTEISDPALRKEIQSYTESTDATSLILSCIERFGGDPSIQRYEITPELHNRTSRTTSPVGWTVRAVRLGAGL